MFAGECMCLLVSVVFAGECMCLLVSVCVCW